MSLTGISGLNEFGTFQNWVGLQDLRFNLLLGELSTDCCQVLKDEFGAFCLPCSRLPTETKKGNRLLKYKPKIVA